MKRKIKITICVVLLIILCGAIYYCYSNYFYAHRLINNIENNNMAKLTLLVEDGHGNVNSYMYPISLTRFVESDNDTALDVALRKGNVKATALLLKNGADAEKCCSNFWTSISIANNNQRQLYELMFENGYSIHSKDEDGESLVCSLPYYKDSSARNQREMLQFIKGLLKENKTITEDEYYELFKSACAHGNIEVASYMIEEEFCTVDSIKLREDPPLISAVQNGDYEMCKYLIQEGADPSARDIDGEMALDVARVMYDDIIEKKSNEVQTYPEGSEKPFKKIIDYLEGLEDN